MYEGWLGLHGSHACRWVSLEPQCRLWMNFGNHAWCKKQATGWVEGVVEISLAVHGHVKSEGMGWRMDIVGYEAHVCMAPMHVGRRV